MYESFYGLKERPFELTPNPRYLCRTPRHREALSNLQYGLSSSRGITLLLGEAGTGKTTLIRTALSSLSANSLCVSLSNPTLTRIEFFDFLAHGFGLSREACASKSLFLRELEILLRDRHDRGLRTALVVDEAQSMPIELLEEIRLLANIETDEEKLLPVILAGQPELADRLNDPSLRQLKQRVALRCELLPFDLQETATYIASRIRVAGGDCAQLFTRDAVRLIFEASGGIPRTISVLCDNALVSGFAAGARPVKSQLVAEVCKDFDLGARDTVARPAGSMDAATEKTPSHAVAPNVIVADGAPAVAPSPAPAPPSAERELFAAQHAGKRRRFVFF
jgi:general secretion pathway protein A